MGRLYPLFPPEGCCAAVVEAGDTLYIPKGFWHEVFTPCVTVAFNVWFQAHASSDLRQTIVHLHSAAFLPFLRRKHAAQQEEKDKTLGKTDLR